VRLPRKSRMAKIATLYYERVARLFGWGLYWRRFASVREKRANSCFLAIVWPPGAGGSIGRLGIRKGEEQRKWRK